MRAHMRRFAVLQVAAPRMDMTLAELQEMATRQQQQIDAQQQLLASKVDGSSETWDKVMT